MDGAKQSVVGGSARWMGPVEEHTELIQPKRMLNRVPTVQTSGEKPCPGTHRQRHQGEDRKPVDHGGSARAHPITSCGGLIRRHGDSSPTRSAPSPHRRGRAGDALQRLKRPVHPITGLPCVQGETAAPRNAHAETAENLTSRARPLVGPADGILPGSLRERTRRAVSHGSPAPNRGSRKAKRPEFSGRRSPADSAPQAGSRPPPASRAENVRES